jgi:hypothetical protein
LRRLAITTIMFLLAIPASAAQAKFFPSTAVDSGDIIEAGDVDLAQDGTGGVAYVKREGGIDHAYVGRFVGGRFAARDRVDPGLEGGSSQAVVGAANGGRLTVFYVSGGVLFANVRPNATAAWTGPQPIAAGGDNPAVDMTVHGVGFGVYRVGGQVFSASMDRRSNFYAPLGAPLNFDASKAAGGGTGRPKLAASAAGSAAVVWGEDGADAKKHVYMRRIFQGSISTAPQDMTLPSFDGRAGLDADLPDIDIEDDASFAWAVFRQQFNDGGVTRSRMIVRQLRGATFDPPQNVDAVGWGEGVNEPKIDINARGEGMSAVTTAGSGAAIFSTLKDQIFRQGLVLGGASAQPEASSTTAYGYDRVAAYTEGNPPVVRGRFYDDSNKKRVLPSPGSPVSLTSGQFGAVDTGPGFDLSGDNAGNALILFTQGTPGARTVVVAGYDLPPGKPKGLSKWTKSRKRPKLIWKSDGDAWGPVTYRVELGGKVVGTTTALKFTAKKKLKFGRRYKFRVTAIDVRGQMVRSSTVQLRVDSKAPSADVSFTRHGKRVTVHGRVADHGTKKRPASGIASVKISWGDGKTKSGSSGTHKYKSGGKKKVRVTVIDKAGNRRTVAKRI